MTKIISLSLDDNLMKEIEGIEKEMQFSGRSELIREGIRALLDDKKSRDALFGEIECILIAVHDEKAEDDITKIKHRYENIIKTQIHNNLKNSKCLEVFVLNGGAGVIRKFSNELQTCRKVSYTKLIVA